MNGKQTDRSPEFRDTVANYLSSLINRRDFAGAIKYFDANRSLIESEGGSWAGSTMLMVASAYASLTNHQSALRAVRKAQTFTAADGDTNAMAEVFMELGRILRNLGQVKEARKALQDAESIFRRNDNLEGQSRALNQLAGLLFSIAEYRNSLRILMDAVEIARQLDDKKKLAYMMGNIGRLQTFMGDFADAFKHIRINIDLSGELGDDLEVARANMSLAYIHIQKAEFTQAEATLNKAYPLLVAANSPRDEAIYYSYLGELEMRAGKFEEARDALNRARAISQSDSDESTLTGRILRLIADLEIKIGDFRSARKTASCSMLIAQKSSNKVEIGLLKKTKAIIAEAAGKKQDALKLYKRAIDLLDESGVRFEKAEALLAAGQSKLFEPRTRITYLFRAEEFYSRSGNTARLNEVGRLLAEIEPSSLGQRKLDRKEPTKPSPLNYLTCSPEIEKFKNQLPMLGRPDLPILLTGETGVGKDHMAKYFHSLVRPDGPYVAINCASVPETLLESELFGYTRGAFTGADSNKTGLFVAANQGVLLLDEIGDMPLSLQAKILGVLERRKLIPLGSTREVEIDIIIVAATNQNLDAMVEAGTFRRDLYYRLSGITFDIPPLRERKSDIPLLLKAFMKERNMLPESGELPEELIRAAVAYDWPGNIRELDNKVKRLQIMTEMVVEGDLAELCRSLFSDGNQRHSAQSDETNSLFDRVEEFERKLITEALMAAGGNKSKAARLLGVHEATVRTKLKRYNIVLSEFGGGSAPN